MRQLNLFFHRSYRYIVETVEIDLQSATLGLSLQSKPISILLRLEVDLVFGPSKNACDHYIAKKNFYHATFSYTKEFFQACAILLARSINRGMIEIRKAQTPRGKRVSVFLKSKAHHIIEASDLALLPALIDPHVHFRIPGAEHKETWQSAARAAIAGGVTTVLDMPNNEPACSTKERLEAKKALIEKQLELAHIPLRHFFYLGADQNHLQEIPKAASQIVGIKIYMGSSTGGLLVHEDEALEKIFRIAAENDVLIAVHAEDEKLLKEREELYKSENHPAAHSLIRSSEVAARAVKQAIFLAEKYKARLYIAHVSTKDELQEIRKAKEKGLSVYAEACPHHLFLNDLAYHTLGTKALVNPPLRSTADMNALWEAIADQTIDTIGTDHAPHTIGEKMRPFRQAPSGFASIEIYLALLLNAYHQQKLSLEQIVSLTHTRPQEIFRLPPNDDAVLVDLEKIQVVDDRTLHTKAKWSPYHGWILKGWPRYTILAGELFDVQNL